MAKEVTIPITDHNTGSPMICTQYYRTRYRLSGTTAWTTVAPDVFTPPIVIGGMPDDNIYEYEITRVCCNNNSSVAATGTFDTH